MKQIVLVFAFASLLGARAGAQGVEDSLRSALRENLQQYLNTRSTVEHISAASLSISLRGQATNINVSAGRTKYGGGKPVTPANLFQIGSNTKAFTAAAILQLEAEGKLTIDQTVGRWLPQYTAWKSVTIRRLLNMTSGIPEYLNQQPLQEAVGKNPARTWSAAELVAFVDPAQGHALPPTTGWSYSNTNYILAQMIIERASGQSYSSEIQRRFLSSDSGLGLNDTYYSPAIYPASVLDRMVSGYFFNTDPGNEGLAPLLGKDVHAFNVSWAQGAGGIVSRPLDVTRWARALYEGGMLAPKQRRELMSIVSNKTGKPIATTTAQDHLGFGLGVGQSTSPAMGTFWFYQGETLGYRMLYGWFPKSDAVIAVGVNSQPPGKENHVGQLIEAVYRTLHATGNL